MRNFKTVIHIDGRSIEDLFRLPCVESIVKNSFPETLGPFTILLYDFQTTVYVGDALCEDHDGKWYAVRNGEETEIINTKEENGDT